jgi:hypothetical protein
LKGGVPFDFANSSFTLEDEGAESEEEEQMSMISLSSSLIDRFGVSSVDGGAADDDEVAGMEPGIVYVLQYNTNSGKTMMMLKMLMNRQPLLNPRSVRFDSCRVLVSWLSSLALAPIGLTHVKEERRREPISDSLGDTQIFVRQWSHTTSV